MLDEFSTGECPTVALHYVKRRHNVGPGLLCGTLKGALYHSLQQSEHPEDEVRRPLSTLPQLDGATGPCDDLP